MAIITMQEVESSNIASIGYDPESQNLRIEFHHGGSYQYSDVPQDIWDGFKNAKSKGKYFYKHIKKGGFAYMKM